MLPGGTRCGRHAACVRRAEARRAGHDAGQIMLLAAVLLVIGFIALAGLVARVQQAGSRTATSQDNPLLLETGPLAAAVDDAVSSVKANFTLLEHGSAAFEENLSVSLDHLVVLLRSRGYLVEHSFACSGVVAHVEVAAHDGRTRVTFGSTVTWTPC